jgi:hypothetical protein
MLMSCRTLFVDALRKLVGGHAMELPRRKFMQLAAGAAVLPAVSRTAWAQAEVVPVV